MQARRCCRAHPREQLAVAVGQVSLNKRDCPAEFDDTRLGKEQAGFGSGKEARFDFERGDIDGLPSLNDASKGAGIIKHRGDNPALNAAAWVGEIHADVILNADKAFLRAHLKNLRFEQHPRWRAARVEAFDQLGIG